MPGDAATALDRLREGNARFVANESTLNLPHADRVGLTAGQAPFAVILGCSDSRVPTEVIFDQGAGKLFVIRVAGNIVQPSQIGSVEFAATKFGTQLVVVLGHTGCGAVEATIEQLERPEEEPSRNIAAIVDRIRPSVEPLIGAASSHEELLGKGVRANVVYSAEALRHGSSIIEGLIERGELAIVGAEYDLETGVVDFFDGTPGVAK